MYLLLIFTALIGIVSCDLNKLYEYCSPNETLCEIPSLMTLCPHSDSGLSKDCPHISEPLSGDDKMYILSLHNKLRNKVATGNESNQFGHLPAASNMLKLRWDDELESIGEKWAERCLESESAESYDDCKDKKRFNVTQNVGIIGSKDIPAEERLLRIFETWNRKNKLFNLSSVDNYFLSDGGEIKEYTNLIWADSYAMGCSRVVLLKNISVSQEDQGVFPWTFERIICNYVPGGNIPGKPIYKRGAPCSDCPTGTNCSIEFPGLCSLNETEGEENAVSLTKKLTTEAELEQDKKELEVVTATTEVIQTPLVSNMQTFAIETVETEIQISAKYSTLSSSEIPVNEAHDTKTEGSKILVRTGIYFNGKCHCPDVSRYGLSVNKILPAEVTHKLKNQVSSFRENSRENEGVKEGKSTSHLKQGDRCYCMKDTSKAFNISAPSRILYTLCIFYFIKLVYYKE